MTVETTMLLYTKDKHSDLHVRYRITQTCTNTVSLYDRKIMVNEFEIAVTVAIWCKKNLSVFLKLTSEA